MSIFFIKGKYFKKVNKESKKKLNSKLERIEQNPSNIENRINQIN